MHPNMNDDADGMRAYIHFGRLTSRAFPHCLSFHGVSQFTP